MAHDDLLNPNELYTSRLKQELHDSSVAYFDELVKKSSIDIQTNKTTCKKIYEKEDLIKDYLKKISGLKTGRGFSILGIVIFGILFVLGIAFISNGIAKTFAIICLVLSPLFIGGFIWLIAAVINKKIKNIRNSISKEENAVKALKSEAFEQMKPLNSAFDYMDRDNIINNCNSIIKMTRTFSNEELNILKTGYGYVENTDETNQTLDAKSGTLCGNPFVIERAKQMHIVPHTYTGHLVIHWTTTYRDGQGHTRTQHHSQTLTATVVKEAPVYNLETWITYGNEAAPHLKFSRTPSEASSYDDKKLESYVRGKEKEFKKLTSKRLKEGKTFTPMSDLKFESLFNALDRDNEVEFRLLFTPLAQQSMVSLLRGKTGYGDDFSIKKIGKLNYISTRHCQLDDIFVGAEDFVHFDYEKCKENFIQYNDGYFKSIYYDLAPILAIPIYQQTPPKFIGTSVFESNLSPYEHDTLISKFNPMIFAHNDTKTDVILKTKFLTKNGNEDILEVTAHSFNAIPHVDHVPVLGGDGHTHLVPVKWYEYIPLTKVSRAKTLDLKVSAPDYNKGLKLNKINAFDTDKNGVIFERGMIACKLDKED